MPQHVVIDGTPRRIEDVVAVAHRQSGAVLSTDQTFIARIQQGASVIDAMLKEDGIIYGVTTGYGDSVTRAVHPSLIDSLSERLFTYHGVGMGLPFSLIETRTVLMARLQSLAQGFSGVSLELLQRLVALLERDVLPVIPQEGSVGASGDLTPLSYVAAVLCGQREVFFQGAIRATSDVFSQLNITPYRLRPKEGLALMNGTAVMTGVACLAFSKAQRLSRFSAQLTAMASATLLGNPSHFDERLFSVKPHRGQQRVAQWIREDLADASHDHSRLQDRYSIRCAPHVIGPLEDSFDWLRSLIENELNSANDNPLIDPESGQLMHGGHFYGGHIALAMDTLKNLIANLADLMDRQLALLVDPRFSHGLPSNLSGAIDEAATVNHGLKALQISASAFTAEALKLTMPASVFSRSTECHNQDKVSMGTIAARDAMRVLQLTEQVAACLAIATRQAVYLRLREGTPLPPKIIEFAGQFSLEPIVEDRALDTDLRSICRQLQTPLSQSK
jgi:histidine ammonia-lyase